MTEIRYRFLQVLRDRGNIFWTLIFPIALALLFNFSFKDLGEESWKDIPTAVVVQEKNEPFESFLKAIDGELIKAETMDEEEAEKALDEGTVSGIYYENETPSLTVASSGLAQTVLASALDSYLGDAAVLTEVANEHPEGLEAAARALADETSYVKEETLGGKSYNYTMDYFYALIGMTCFFGCFTGMKLGEACTANQSVLAARRSVAPIRKSRMVLTDMLVGFSVQYGLVLVLLAFLDFVLDIRLSGGLAPTLLVCAMGALNGVSFGIVLGCAGRVSKSIRIGLSISVPLLSSFLAGMMIGDMKQTVEEHMPLINRINPSALISDAFYYINIYPDRSGLMRCLVTLAGISLGLAFLAFLMMRRTRYDSL
jgi:ABC-2 type transport system permease protein